MKAHHYIIQVGWVGNHVLMRSSYSTGIENWKNIRYYESRYFTMVF